MNFVTIAPEHTWGTIMVILGFLPERFRMYPDYSKTSKHSTIILEIVRKEVESTLYNLKMVIAAESDHLEASSMVRHHLSFAMPIIETMLRWSELFYEEDAASYDGPAMRSCLQRDILDKSREHRAALGGRGGHHKFQDKIMSRVLFPNRRNPIADPLMSFFYRWNKKCIALD
jgi:hypothetical protein